MYKYHKILNVFAFLLLFLVAMPGGVIAEDVASTIEDTVNEPSEEVSNGGPDLLYNGTLDTENSISVIADSGSSFTISGSTPIGVLQSLKNSGTIEKFSVGDELMKKKGILLLDAIENLSSDEYYGWFVKVNGNRLEDVVLAETMGLNRFTLKEGDVVLYALGDPKGMVSESKAYLTVTIGSVLEAPAPIPTTNETVSPETENQNTEISTAIPNESPSENISEEEIEQGTEVNASEQGTETSETTKTPASDNQEDLFSGSFSLPSGMVNITASSGGDYEIEGATPLGLLQKLKEDDKISEISVSDRAMRKGGILLLEGINDYYYTGDKTWFVVVNDYQVKDYLYPETDGLNVYKIKAGDKVGYYFGEPSKPADDAEVKMLVTIE